MFVNFTRNAERSKSLANFMQKKCARAHFVNKLDTLKWIQIFKHNF